MIHAFAHRLRRDARGVTAIEFAFVAPVMLLLLMGLSDLSYQCYVQAMLTGAMQKAGRDSTIQGATTKTSQIDAAVMRWVLSVNSQATYVSSRKSYAQFSSIKPESFVDANGNGLCDAGESFTDINGNNTWDADPGTTGQGGANDVVLYKMTVTYPRLFPLFGMLGWGANQTITASTILKNQPWAAQNTYTPNRDVLMLIALARCSALARRLRRDRSGLAMMEFAFTLPIVMAMGGYGVELSYLSLTSLRVFQAAVNLADSASRVGTVVGVVTQLREVDVNDVLQGIRLTNQNIQLTTYGRVILSSLENTQQNGDFNRVQRIHWQRCMGLQSGANFDSHYGTTSPTDGTTSSGSDKGTAAPSGMGDTNQKVNAPQDTGVMFVEVNYQYRPLFGSMFVSPQVIHYTQSFIVRDNRDFKQLYNPSPTATAATCNLYTA